MLVCEVKMGMESVEICEEGGELKCRTCPNHENVVCTV